MRSANPAVSGHVIRPLTLEHVVLVCREMLVQMLLLQEGAEFPELVVVQTQSLMPRMQVRLGITLVYTVHRVPLANTDHALILVHGQVPVVGEVQRISQERVGVADLEGILNVMKSLLDEVDLIEIQSDSVLAARLLIFRNVVDIPQPQPQASVLLLITIETGRVGFVQIHVRAKLIEKLDTFIVDVSVLCTDTPSQCRRTHEGRPMATRRSDRRRFAVIVNVAYSTLHGGFLTVKHRRS